MEPVVRSPETDDEWREVEYVFQRGFSTHVDAERAEEALRHRLPDRCLAVFADGQVAAAAQVRPFAMFLGGRPVPLGGYSPVAVAPEWRGRGHATRITQAHFPHLRERGEVVAGLFPASTRLYRQAGFEVAGVYVLHSIFTRHLNQLRPRAAWPVARRLGLDDLPAVKECYRRHAATQDGWLDRPDAWWDRIVENFGKEHWYGVDAGARGGALAGYVRYRHEPAAPPFSYDLMVHELVADDPDVMAGLWKLVGSSSSQAHQTRFYGPHEHPLLHLLPEQDAKVELDIRWMARIIDVAAAIEARGYPEAVTATVDLEIHDPACDWNTGRWRLHVEGGSGQVTKGGEGTVSMSVNGLSSLFTGYASAVGLRQVGLASGGSSRDLAALTAAFCGPTPWHPDFY